MSALAHTNYQASSSSCNSVNKRLLCWHARPSGTHHRHAGGLVVRGQAYVSRGSLRCRRDGAPGNAVSGSERLLVRSSGEGEVVTSTEATGEESNGTGIQAANGGPGENGSGPAEEAAAQPPGELTYVEPSQARKFLSWWKLQWALPWRRFSDKSVLVLELGGEIGEKPTGRWGDAKSISQITRALQKAALDYRVEGVYLKISGLGVGWAKLQELVKYLDYFRASGKWSCAYLERAGEKEYFLASACEEVFVPPSGNLSLRGLSVSGSFLRGVLDKVGVEPQVKRIGIYKSAGDQLLRKDMSDAQREQLTALLDDIYAGFMAQVARSRKKTLEEVEAMLNAGIYKMEEYAEGGWVTALKYEDEVLDLLKKRTGGKEDEVQAVPLKKYSFVSPTAFGLYGRKKIAVLRASGAIVGGDGMASGMITAKSVINQLRALGKNKRIAAVVLRVDSPGGDALASDLMWREIRKLRDKKPVIACMSDVAASGGYYMAMACEKIVAESLTITGSIGVVTGKFNLQKLYERLGFAKTFISKGEYAELLADNRPFSEQELKLFDESAEYAYESFRDKAAESRGLSVEAMQQVAQGRVWSGKRALDIGLIDAVGGLPRAVQLAREAAKIDAEEDVSVVEVSRQQPLSPLALISQLASLRLPALLQVVLGGQLQGSRAAAVLGLLGGAAPNSAELQSLLTPGRPLALMPDIQVLGASELQ